MKNIKRGVALFLVAMMSGCGNPNNTAKAPTPNTPKQITVGKMGTYHVTHVLERAFYSDGIGHFFFLPDGRTLVGLGAGFPQRVLSGEETRPLLFFFDTRTGAETKRVSFLNGRTARGRQYWDRAILSPDGRLIASWGVSNNGETTSLLIIDIAQGRVVSQFDEPNWGIRAAAWDSSGELLVARYTSVPTRHLQMLVCSHDGTSIRKTINLPNIFVMEMETTTRGAPRALVTCSTKRRASNGDPLAQCSIRQWRNDALSAPIMKFPVGEFYLDAAFGKNTVALCGFDQLYRAGADKGAVYTLADTKRKRIVWRKQMPTRYISQQLWLSPEEQRIWPAQAMRKKPFVLDIRTGASSTVGPDDFLIFSPDGKRILRRLTTEVPGAQKPHLPIAELLQR